MGAGGTYVGAIKVIPRSAVKYDGDVLLSVQPNQGDVVIAIETGARQIAAGFDAVRRTQLDREEVLGRAQVHDPHAHFWIRRLHLENKKTVGT